MYKLNLNIVNGEYAVKMSNGSYVTISGNVIEKSYAKIKRVAIEDIPVYIKTPLIDIYNTECCIIDCDEERADDYIEIKEEMIDNLKELKNDGLCDKETFVNTFYHALPEDLRKTYFNKDNSRDDQNLYYIDCNFDDNDLFDATKNDYNYIVIIRKKILDGKGCKLNNHSSVDRGIIAISDIEALEKSIALLKDNSMPLPLASADKYKADECIRIIRNKAVILSTYFIPATEKYLTTKYAEALANDFAGK